MLHGQQIDIAMPGDIKNMSILTNELFFTAFKPLSVDRASQITRLYNIHISSNVSAALKLMHLSLFSLLTPRQVTKSFEVVGSFSALSSVGFRSASSTVPAYLRSGPAASGGRLNFTPTPLPNEANEEAAS